MSPEAMVHYPDLLQRLPNAAQERITEQLDELKLADAQLQDAALHCLVASRFVARWARRYPQAFVELLRTNFAPAGAALVVDLERETAGLDLALRQRRHQEMVRLAARQLLSLDTPLQTVEALSALADELLRVCVAEHWGRLVAKAPGADSKGAPRPVLFALGKLGGRELNFSSDVDLVFAYTNPDRACADQAPQWHARLAQRCSNSLNSAQAEGFVYRVDLRLRPFGRQGAPSLSLEALDSYFETHARDWERYAWQKARCVAGDLEAGEEWLQELRPFIYRRYIDFGQLASLRAMKDEIDADVRSKAREQDIKRGWGGIRELEFFVQALQLIHGGARPSLQSRRFRVALHALVAEELVEEDLARRWEEAYWYLRRVENCWQAVNDEQTHVLPLDEEPRQRLLAALAVPSWDAFEQQLQQVRSFVRARFLDLFAPTGREELSGPSRELLAALKDEAATLPPAVAGLHQALQHLRRSAFRRLEQAGTRSDLLELSVRLLETTSDDATAQRVLELCEKIAGRPNYVTMLLQHPAARRELLELCHRSAPLAAELSRRPALLIELCEPESLYAPPGREDLRAEIGRQLAACDEDDFEEQLEQLRRIRHAIGLRIAAADVSNALPLMRVSDHLTELAEETVRGALQVAIAQMRQRWPGLGTPPFAIVAYGKLGGLELSYASDLDLVFLYAPQPVPGVDLDPQVFYTRLAQKLINALSTQTGSGRCYEVDMRLRPNGNAGLLVTAIDAFERYQNDSAWTWEHQALVRSRAIAGDESVANEFAVLRQRVLRQARDSKALREEILSMRQKMLSELAPKDGEFDPKHSPGGMVDIEFFVQYLVLANAETYEALTRFTDVVRILELAARDKVLDKETAEALQHNYRHLRARVHADTLGLPPPADLALGPEQSSLEAMLAGV